MINEYLNIVTTMFEMHFHCLGQLLSGSNDENLVDDLMSILKNEVTNKKSKNVDILQLSSQICLKLNGKILYQSFFHFL